MVRAGRLKPPGDPDFDLDAWAAVADETGDPALQGRLDSVAWFDAQLRAVKQEIADLRLGNADRERLLRELCGWCNFAYTASEAELRGAIACADPRSLPMGSVSYLLFRTETGDVGNADALRTAATDALGRALRQLAAHRAVKRAPTGIAARAAAAYAAFTRLYVLEYYRDKLLWQDWRVKRDGAAWRLLPPDPDPFGISAIAVDWRRDQEHGEWTLVAGAAWAEGRGWAETVVRDTGAPSPRRFAIVVRVPGEGAIPAENVLRWQIEGSDLATVQDQPLPGFAPDTVTLSDLIDSILLWSSAAQTLLNSVMPRLSGARPREFAAPIAPADLIALREGMGWSQRKARAVLDFFTYDGRTHDGVWSKPFVPLPSGALVPIFSALIGPNLYRSAEIWLAEAGGAAIQQSRGAAFEDQVYRGLRDAVREERLDGVVVAKPWSIKVAGARRDIDLAIRIGRTVFLGEEKLKRFPAEPREAARWADELAKGAQQARLRSEFLAGKPDSAAECTDYAGKASDLVFEPFVLVSGYFGAGVTIAGVPIIDIEGLMEFFAPGYFGALGEVGPGSHLRATLAVPLRLPGDDLATAFSAYLREPVRIRAIERAMRPLHRTIGFPAIDGDPIRSTQLAVDPTAFTDGQTLFEDVSAHWNRVRAAAGLPALPPVE